MKYETFKAAVTANGYPAPRIEVFNEFLNARSNFTDAETAMFLAQLIHESTGFQHREELAYVGKEWHDDYRDTVSLPGRLYHGRGYIQLTWAANYLRASQDLGMRDMLLKQPQLVSESVKLSMDVSKWYWTERVRLALKRDPNCFGVTTKAINGLLECSPNGDHTRARRRYEIYKTVAKEMKIKNLASEEGCYPLKKGNQ